MRQTQSFSLTKMMKNELTVCLRKTYASKELMRSEERGLAQLAAAGNSQVPKVVAKGEDFLVLEYVSGAKTALQALQDGSLTEEELVDQLANFLADIHRSYQRLGKDVAEWEKKKSDIVISLERNSSTLLVSKLLTQPEIRGLTERLGKIDLRRIPAENLTFLHRDLHLGNILVDKGRVLVIDFEHCAEGPLEFEFQNSLFFADEKSLPVEKIKCALRRRGLIYSDLLERRLTPLYFADQINLAVELEDLQKLQTLTSKWRTKSERGGGTWRS